MLVKRFPYDPIEIAATGLGVLIVVALAFVFLTAPHRAHRRPAAACAQVFVLTTPNRQAAPSPPSDRAYRTLR